MKTDIYRFLKECALAGESIKEGCEKRGVNPVSVRKFLYFARRKPYLKGLKGRVVKRGRYVGFRYDGVIVFWDRVVKEEEEERGRGEPGGSEP